MHHQILTLFTTLLTTTTALSLPRQSTPTWQITNLTATGTPSLDPSVPDTTISISFSITDGSLATTCVSDASGAAYCADNAYQFFWNPEAPIEDLPGAYYLEIFETTCGSTCVFVGEEHFAASQVETIGNEQVLAVSGFTLVSMGAHT